MESQRRKSRSKAREKHGKAMATSVSRALLSKVASFMGLMARRWACFMLSLRCSLFACVERIPCGILPQEFFNSTATGRILSLIPHPSAQGFAQYIFSGGLALRFSLLHTGFAKTRPYTRCEARFLPHVSGCQAAFNLVDSRLGGQRDCHTTLART